MKQRNKCFCCSGLNLNSQNGGLWDGESGLNGRVVKDGFLYISVDNGSGE